MNAPAAAARGHDALFDALYPQLRRLAHAQLRRNEPVTLLDTTGLVHEAWLRLAGNEGTPVHDRGFFLGCASRVKRFIVIDFVRQRHAQRRGGAHTHVTLDTAIGETATLHDEQVLRLHEALEELAQVDERLVRIVEMRSFGGLSEVEIAATLGVTDRTVRREWRRARALLHAALA